MSSILILFILYTTIPRGPATYKYLYLNKLFSQNHLICLDKISFLHRYGQYICQKINQQTLWSRHVHYFRSQRKNKSTTDVYSDLLIIDSVINKNRRRLLYLCMTSITLFLWCRKISFLYNIIELFFYGIVIQFTVIFIMCHKKHRLRNIVIDTKLFNTLLKRKMNYCYFLDK